MTESQLSGDDSETIDLEDMDSRPESGSKDSTEAPETADVEVSAGEGSKSAGDISGGGMSKDSKPPAESGTRKHTWLIVAGLALITVLIIVGLFLPPVSLGERLGLWGDETDEVSETSEDSEPVESSVDAEGATVYVSEGDNDVDINQVSQADFTTGEAGREWEPALAALPEGLVVASDVYGIDSGDEPVVGSVEIAIGSGSQPIQTLDLYGWDGQNWNFVPSNIDDQGDSLTSIEGELPKVLALMQTSAPAVFEIGAEQLPALSLPSQALTHLTELTVGTLTLGGEGMLLGEPAETPTGGYRKFLRATNTGAIVDTVSLGMLLSDPGYQEQNIAALVDAAVNGDFAGVNLDYQGVSVEQKQAFNAFVRTLADSLHENGLDLVITLETAVFMDGEWDTAGQDWASLGEIADVVYAQMPLDPTAYGDDQLAEETINWATRQIDRSKLMMLYSVNAVDSVGGNYRDVDQTEALAEFGEVVFLEGSDEIDPGEPVTVSLSGSAGLLEWDPASLTYRYAYEQGGQPHDVWLGSEALVTHRGRFADRYHLRGIGVRGLGSLAGTDGYSAAFESMLGEGEPPQPASAGIVWKVLNESGDVIASSTGDKLTFTWDGEAAPGEYLIQADFAQGDSISTLALQSIFVAEDLAEAEPTPEPEETEEEAEEAEEPTETPQPEPTNTPAQPTTANLGDADAAATTPANVRSGPGLGYGIIAGLQTGEKVTLIGRNDDSSWLNIDLPGDQEGWVFAQLLTINPSVNVGDLALVEVEPPTVAGGGDGGDTGASAPPPVIAPAGGGSFELGGQTHTLANPALMQSAGMNWVKFQHKWGPGDSPDAVAGRIQQAHANGMKVLLSMPGANAYPSSIDFNGYVEFLRGVAALGPDAIEVWNEMNIDFEWPAGQIDPASYVNNMLAPAYNAIKSANPSVMVISGAPAPTGFDNGTNAWSDSRYMAGVAAAGGGNYMDCIGVHHNAGATSPNASSGHPAGGTHYSWYFWPTLNMYYNSFGGARPVCFTELGYLSGQDFGGVPSRFSWAGNTSVAQHAQWLAEAASLSANSGKVRMMIVFNVDFTHWGDDPQAGYAMLRPDGSCPSCGLLGQVMGR